MSVTPLAARGRSRPKRDRIDGPTSEAAIEETAAVAPAEAMTSTDRLEPAAEASQPSAIPETPITVAQAPPLAASEPADAIARERGCSGVGRRRNRQRRRSRRRRSSSRFGGPAAATSTIRASRDPSVLRASAGRSGRPTRRPSPLPPMHRLRRPAPTMRPRPWRTLPRLRRRRSRARTAKVPAAAATGVAPSGTSAPSVRRARNVPSAVKRAERPARGDRPQRGDRPTAAPRGDRPDRDPDLRAKYIKGRGEGRDRRDREPDPNSPFAKLAALKEQLEANAKEPRVDLGAGHWTASASTNGCGTRGWCARARRRRRSPRPVTCGSTVSASMRRAARVRPGDVVTVALDRAVRVLKVLGFAERRGSADDARVLCETIEPPSGRPAAPATPPPAGGRPARAGRPSASDAPSTACTARTTNNDQPEQRAAAAKSCLPGGHALLTARSGELRK